MNSVRKSLLAAGAVIGLLLVTAVSATAGPQPLNPIFYKKVHLACAVSGYTYAIDQHWKVQPWTTRAAPTDWTLLYEDEGTAPAFRANRVEADGLDGIQYTHGGSASSVDDVPSSISHAVPNVYGLGSNHFTTYEGDQPSTLQYNAMIISGVGSGAATAVCSDYTPTITSE